jgi:hypothetical protein
MSARTYWRASLVPAAAVIPAPIAYIKVVAVKTLVVGALSTNWVALCASLFNDTRPSWLRLRRLLYFEKIRVFQAGISLDTSAWNNLTGLTFFLIGSTNVSNGKWGRLGTSVLGRERWNSVICRRRTTAKAFVKVVPVDQERKLGDRRRLDTVVVLTINYAD